MRFKAILATLIYSCVAFSAVSVLADEPVDPKAAVTEANLILSGNPAGDALTHAIDLLMGAASNRSVAALKELGEIYAAGKYGVTADVAAAAVFYERAITLGDNASRARLAALLLSDSGIPADPLKAVNLLQDAADNGDIGAAITLARLYSQGAAGISPDGRKAIALLTPLAKAGSVRAATELGNLYLKGPAGIGTNLLLAVKYLQQAVDLDSNDARRVLASLYLDGRGVTQDTSLAVALLTEAAEAGDASAYATLGRIYGAGAGGVTVDGVKAVEAYEAAIAAGYMPALTRLAALLTDGKVVTADPARASRLLKHAIEIGDAQATLQLARLYAIGQGGMQVDGEQAVSLLEPLADGGDPAALSALGDIYASGAGTVAGDTDKAIAYYSKANKLGARPAAKKAATLLARGVGGSANLDAAVALLEPLGQAGDAGAYLTLGDMFSKAEVTTPDIERAKYYYEMAAKAGDPAGIARIASLLSTGTLGVSPDGDAAVSYYRQAIDAGDVNARRGLANLLIAGKVVQRDVPTAIVLLKEAVAEGDGVAAIILGRIYSSGGPDRASYPDAKAAFEQARALGEKSALLSFATALLTEQFGVSHVTEGRQLLLAAVDEKIPGARDTLARLQATGRFPGSGYDDAVSTLKEGVATGDVGSIRYLLQIYREGVNKLVEPRPIEAQELLKEVSALLPPSIEALETALLSAKTASSPGAFADFSEQLGKLARSEALGLVRRLRTLNPNAYVYLVQEYLTRRDYYHGQLNGLLTGLTIRAFNAACKDANSLDRCLGGPLSTDAVDVISSLILLPHVEDVRGSTTNVGITM